MDEPLPHRVRTSLLSELKRQPRNGIVDMNTCAHQRPRITRKARLTWLAVVPSAFLMTFVGLLWLHLGTQLVTGTAASLQPTVSDTNIAAFLQAPASDTSVPRASDVLSHSVIDADTEPVPTF